MSPRWRGGTHSRNRVLVTGRRRRVMFREVLRPARGTRHKARTWRMRHERTLARHDWVVAAARTDARRYRGVGRRVPGWPGRAGGRGGGRAVPGASAVEVR